MEWPAQSPNIVNINGYLWGHFVEKADTKTVVSHQRGIMARNLRGKGCSCIDGWGCKAV